VYLLTLANAWRSIVSGSSRLLTPGAKLLTDSDTGPKVDSLLTHLFQQRHSGIKVLAPSQTLSNLQLFISKCRRFERRLNCTISAGSCKIRSLCWCCWFSILFHTRHFHYISCIETCWTANCRLCLCSRLCCWLSGRLCGSWFCSAWVYLLVRIQWVCSMTHTPASCNCCSACASLRLSAGI
jgi:hypothetical protein